MKTERTRKNLPSHLAVRRDESEIAGWRQHSLRVFGDGSGQWKWSPPTDVPLKQSGFSDGQKLPDAYSVRRLAACRAHSKAFNPDCAECCTPVSAPMMVSKQRANTVPLLTPKEYYAATVRWRNQVKAAEMKGVRNSVPKERSHGPLTLLTTLINKLKESRALLDRANQGKEAVLQAQAFLDSALADAEAVSQKLKR